MGCCPPSSSSPAPASPSESGVATFRDKDGIWSKVDYRDVATPQGFARDPGKVHDFYNMRRARHGRRPAERRACRAGAAGTRFRRRLPAGHTEHRRICTRQAGSAKLVHMHGELAKSLCGALRRAPHVAATTCRSSCTARHCGSTGGMRPDVVWFGEMPVPHGARSTRRCRRCDLFVSIGTSGTVHPAAGFVAGGEGRRRPHDRI